MFVFLSVCVIVYPRCTVILHSIPCIYQRNEESFEEKFVNYILHDINVIECMLTFL